MPGQSHREPHPTAVTTRGIDEQYRQPNRRQHRKGIRSSLDACPCRPRQDRAHESGNQCDSSRRELLAQHNDSGCGASNRQTAWHPRPEFRRRKNSEPAVHGHVVQTFDGIDVAQHPPQLTQRTTVGGRNRGGLVVPERRTACTSQAHGGGQHCNDQRVEPTSRRCCEQTSEIPAEHVAMVPEARGVPGKEPYFSVPPPASRTSTTRSANGRSMIRTRTCSGFLTSQRRD